MAGVFTQNRFCAAPVRCAASIWPDRDMRALVVNTGNANAGTGEEGLEDARADLRCGGATAGLCDPEQVLPFSTGVILEPLPVDKMLAALPAALADLPRQPTGWKPPTRS